MICMRREIYIYTFIACLTLLMVPTIPSMEFSMVKETYETNVENYFEQTINFQEKNNGITNKIDFSHMIVILKQFFGKITNTKKSLQSEGDDEQPLFFPFLGIFVYALIAIIILKIIGIILHFIGGKINLVIQFIKAKITNFITKTITLLTTISTIIISLFTLLVNIIVYVTTTVYNLISTTVLIITNVIVLIVSGIVTLFLLTLQGIINIIAKIWFGIGEVLRFIVEVIQAILDAIFPNYHIG